jgi:hypothetical protein
MTIISERLIGSAERRRARAFLKGAIALFAIATTAIAALPARAAGDEPAAAVAKARAGEQADPRTREKAGAGKEAKPAEQDTPGSGNRAVPAPLLGALMIPTGEGRLLYLPNYTEMRDNYVGASEISPAAIVASVPYVPSSPIALLSNRPRTLRIVPTSLNIQTHTILGLYGVTDELNLMVMTTIVDKNLSLTTFRGPVGVTPLGQSTVVSEGWGDSAAMALVRIYKDDIHRVHINLGLGIPTGSVVQQTRVLSPLGVYTPVRSGYPMQLGNGTFDGLFGVTYTGKYNQWNWGFMYRGRIAFGNNDEGYQRGPWHELNGWGAYEFAKGLSFTARASLKLWDRIYGYDPAIFGPAQLTSPYLFGGERVKLLGGFEIISKLPDLNMKPIRIAIEAGAPVYQSLNGPQLGQAWELNAALGLSF